MNKTAIVLIAFIFASFSIISCQKAKEPEEKKSQAKKQEAPIPKEEAKQPPLETKPAEIKPVETKTEVQPQQQKQPSIKPKEKKEMGEKEAAEYYFPSLERMIDEGMKITDSNWEYNHDICAGMGDLWRVGNEDKYYKLIIKVLKTYKFPDERACAASSLLNKSPLFMPRDKAMESMKEEIISALKEALSDKDAGVRMEAGGALLTFGENDIALPALDEVARGGEWGTHALNKLFSPEERKKEGGERWIVVSHTKLWDERGKEILIKALSYSSDEVKAFAAASLADIGIERELVEATSIKILERLKGKKEKDYKTEKEWHSDGRAGHHASAALERIKSIKGISVLKELIENNDDQLLRGRAKKALENIQQNSGRLP